MHIRAVCILLALFATLSAWPPQSQAQAPQPRLLLMGARVSESFIPQGSADSPEAGGRAIFSLIVEHEGASATPIEAEIQLPKGMRYLSETLRLNGLPAQPATLIAGQRLRFAGLTVPPAQGQAAGNLAGLHVFLSPEPSLAEIDRRLDWAAKLVGPGGTLKLFLPGITEQTAEAPYWMVYAVRKVYALGLRPVVRLGYANGDASSFTRKWDDGAGQMSRADAVGGYWGIGWATRLVAAHLLASSADAAAGAPSAELTLIVGNEPNLEWVERDWFIDYSYVRQADGSFDPNWLTTDPHDPFAKANSPEGWKLFVRGLPGANGQEPGYDERLDDYTRYLGYDAAVEYARFLRTTSGLLQELDNPRLLVAAGAIASGGGDLEGRYAYHQRHFIRRMLRAVPDALSQIDLWTTNNYPYTLPPWDNYHSRPANFDSYPLGEPFWHTEIGIDSYQGDLDYLAYLRRQGLATSVPTRAIIGEVGYGIGEGWGTAFGGPPLTEDLRARYMADIFETYYNNWRSELAQVNLWQLGDPEHARPTFHMFDMVFPDSEDAQGWPTHRHLVFDALATRASRPGPGRLILSFQAQLDADIRPGYVEATARLLPAGPAARYTLLVVE